MLKLVALLFFCTQLTFAKGEAGPLTIQANLWKKENCTNQSPCLPQGLGLPKIIEIPEPSFQSFSQVESFFGDYRALFTLTKRQESGGYYSFQIELQDAQTFETIVLCSRYEALDTFEEVVVGACGGKAESFQGLIGISLTIPR